MPKISIHLFILINNSCPKIIFFFLTSQGSQIKIKIKIRLEFIVDIKFML